MNSLAQSLITHLQAEDETAVQLCELVHRHGVYGLKRLEAANAALMKENGEGKQYHYWYERAEKAKAANTIAVTALERIESGWKYPPSSGMRPPPEPLGRDGMRRDARGALAAMRKANH